MSKHNCHAGKSKQLWYKNLHKLHDKVTYNYTAAALLELLNYYAYFNVTRTIVSGKKVYRVRLTIARPLIITGDYDKSLVGAMLLATRRVLNEYA